MADQFEIHLFPAKFSSNLAMADQFENLGAEDYLWFCGDFDETNGCCGGDNVKGKEVENVDTGDGSAAVVKDDKEANDKGKGKRKRECEFESHIHMERERRKKMRSMFTDLHAMLPHLPPKIDKTTIVDEAMKHIKTLELTLQKLQQKKAERVHGVTYEPSGSTAPHQKVTGGTAREPFVADGASSPGSLIKMPSLGQKNLGFRTWTSPNVVLNTFGEKAHIMVRSARRPDLFKSILVVLEKHKIEVDSAHVSCNEGGSSYMIQAHHANGASGQSADTYCAEGVYKDAVQDLMLLFRPR